MTCTRKRLEHFRGKICGSKRVIQAQLGAVTKTRHMMSSCTPHFHEQQIRAIVTLERKCPTGIIASFPVRIRMRLPLSRYIPLCLHRARAPTSPESIPPQTSVLYCLYTASVRAQTFDFTALSTRYRSPSLLALPSVRW